MPQDFPYDVNDNDVANNDVDDNDVDDNNVDDKGVDDDDDDDDVEGRGLVLSWGQMFLSPAWHPAFLSPTATFTLCFIFQIIFSICGGDCESENFAQRPIRPFSSKDFKTTIFTVALFMVQISLKYFHSLEPQNHITLNLSQIFDTHPSTSLLKVPLTP